MKPIVATLSWLAVSSLALLACTNSSSKDDASDAAAEAGAGETDETSGEGSDDSAEDDDRDDTADDDTADDDTADDDTADDDPADDDAADAAANDDAADDDSVDDAADDAAADDDSVDDAAEVDAATDDTPVEDDSTDDPATDDPATDDPATDDPATDDPATDDPATDDPATDDPATDDPATDDPATDDPATDDPATDDPATDDPATDDPATDDPATDDPATDDPATDDVMLPETCMGSTWDHDGDAATACVEHQVCEPGEFIEVPGGAETDAVCAECPAGTFSTEPNASACLPWTECEGSQVQTTAPTATSDRSCGTTSFSCGEGQWDHDDDSATPCVNYTTCVPGQYVTRLPSETQDRLCSPCLENRFSTTTNALTCSVFTTCPAGTYVGQLPSATQNRECLACPDGMFADEPNSFGCTFFTTCNPGQIEVSPGSPTADRVCEGAPPPTCDAGTWDHDANPMTACVPHTDCEPGEFVADEGTGVMDRLCEPCAGGTYSTGDNATECLPWTECVAGQYVLVEESPTQNRVCAGCDAGTFSTDPNAESCEPWSTCASGTYVSNTPSESADRICTGCPDGTYTPSSNLGACLEADECVAGTVQTAPGTPSSPPTCAACAAGTYCAGGVAPQVACDSEHFDHDLNSATACAPKTTCVAGEYVDVAGSAVADRSCDACADGAYSDEPNAPSCTTWTECTELQFQSAAGTPTSDRVCTPIKVVQVAAAGRHTCARRNDGVVRCWGFGLEGQIGDGGNTNRNAPDNDVGGLGFVSDLSAGRNFTCALMDTGSVRCWGAGGNGRLGNGSTANVLQPATNTMDVGSTASVAAGSAHACVLTTGGGVRCWGWGLFGQLGAGGTPGAIGDVLSPPIANIDFGSDAPLQVRAGLSHTCALMQGGGIRCWGDNNASTFLGYGDFTSRSLPGPYLPFTGGLVPETLVLSHGPANCALFTDDNLRCWGWNPNGLLGYDSTTSIGGNLNPNISNAVNLAGIVQHSVGREHACALLANGNVKCWGRGAHGALGNGSSANVSDGVGASITTSLPVDFGTLPDGVSVVQVSAGGESAGGHSCAVLSDGNVRCWGWGASGQLGYGNFDSRTTPGPNITGLIP